MDEVIFRFEAAVLGDWQRKVWDGLDWTVRRGEQWAVTGPNGAGKSFLCRLLSGDLPGGLMRSGQVERLVPASAVYWIGFEAQEALIMAERRHDDTDFLEAPDPGTLLADFLPVAGRARAVRFGLEGRLDTGLKYLSTGEIRKALLCRALADEAGILLLDEPFAGLDAGSREVLRQVLAEAAADGRQLVWLTQKPAEVPGWVTHRLEIDGCRVVGPGLSGPVVAAEPVLGSDPALTAAVVAEVFAGASALDGPALVELRGGRVVYGEREIFAGLDWRFEPGHHWQVAGPNGSGKSTLLGLVTGENLQVYKQDICLFGKGFGDGLLLSQARQQMGLVSYALQVEHNDHVRNNCLEVVLSGVFGSIGLYQEPSGVMIHRARLLLAWAGLTAAGSRDFAGQSFGVQRRILLLRALIRAPRLLILDEPCQGLDEGARRQFLALAEELARRQAVSLLYVTHDPAEVLPSLTHRLTFIPREGAPALVKKEVLTGGLA